MRTGLTIFGIALGIFAVVVMGGMSEHMNLTFDRSMSLTADKIRVMPEGTFGGSLDESKIREVKRVPGVADAFGLLIMPLDPENLGMLPSSCSYAPISNQPTNTINDIKNETVNIFIKNTGDSFFR